jgi:hypothetical protein
VLLDDVLSLEIDNRAAAVELRIQIGETRRLKLSYVEVEFKFDFE